MNRFSLNSFCKLLVSRRRLWTVFFFFSIRLYNQPCYFIMKLMIKPANTVEECHRNSICLSVLSLSQGQDTNTTKTVPRVNGFQAKKFWFRQIPHHLQCTEGKHEELLKSSKDVLGWNCPLLVETTKSPNELVCGYALSPH